MGGGAEPLGFVKNFSRCGGQMERNLTQRTRRSEAQSARRRVRGGISLSARCGRSGLASSSVQAEAMRCRWIRYTRTCPTKSPTEKETYTPNVQKAMDPNVGCRKAPPIAIAAIMVFEIKSDCRGSRHHLKGFLNHDGRGSGSAFQRRIEYETVKIAKRGNMRRMIKHGIGPRFV